MSIELADVVHVVEDLSPVLVPVAVWVAWIISARRFERRRLREGTWDKHGPKDPTFAPPDPNLRAVGIQVPTIDLSRSPHPRGSTEPPDPNE